MKKNRGFTLVELMIVMAVIAVLATIALFGLRRAQQAARDSERHAVMNGMQVALENYYGVNRHYGNAAVNTFCLTVALLRQGATPYLASDPMDPGTDSVICTGPLAGNPTIGGATYTFVGGSQDECPLIGGQCWQSYTLTLGKESGGTSTYQSPQ